MGLLLAYRWYRKMEKNEKLHSGLKEGDRIRVTYTGPALQYTGLTLKSGNIIEGTYHDDGSLSYEFWGNGIIASNETFKIPYGDYNIIAKI